MSLIDPMAKGINLFLALFHCLPFAIQDLFYTVLSVTCAGALIQFASHHIRE